MTRSTGSVAISKAEANGFICSLRSLCWTAPFTIANRSFRWGGGDAFVLLLQHLFVAGLDPEEDALAAGPPHLREELEVHLRDPGEALPGQWQPGRLDRLRQREGPLVVQREDVVRHPDVVVTELGDLPHLGHHRLGRAGAEEVPEHRLVAELASEGAVAGVH